MYTHKNKNNQFNCSLFSALTQHLPRESASGLLLQARGPPTSVSAAIAAAQASQQAANDASH